MCMSSTCSSAKHRRSHLSPHCRI
uniref:Uncharacterized protein n=1 Tax=Anguilla anguilla TaxID=7936 RepID=A0A0E9TKZ8_ANGAN